MVLPSKHNVIQHTSLLGAFILYEENGMLWIWPLAPCITHGLQHAFSLKFCEYMVCEHNSQMGPVSYSICPQLDFSVLCNVTVKLIGPICKLQRKLFCVVLWSYVFTKFLAISHSICFLLKWFFCSKNYSHWMLCISHWFSAVIIILALGSSFHCVTTFSVTTHNIAVLSIMAYWQHLTDLFCLSLRS